MREDWPRREEERRKARLRGERERAAPLSHTPLVAKSAALSPLLRLPQTRTPSPRMNVADPQGSKARSSGVIVRVCASSGGAPMDAAPRRAAAAASAADEEDGEETSSPPSSSLNDLGRAIVFAIPASRAARWLWSRRRGIGVAVGLAGVGPGVLGVGALRLCGVSLAVALLPLPGGWRSVQGVALLGALPGVQVSVWGAEANCRSLAAMLTPPPKKPWRAQICRRASFPRPAPPPARPSPPPPSPVRGHGQAVPNAPRPGRIENPDTHTH